MAKELTENEEKGLNDLKKNMGSRLSEFKRQNQDKSKEELQRELSKLEGYLKGCYNSEIDDTEINIRFCGGKAEILKGLIKRSS